MTAITLESDSSHSPSGFEQEQQAFRQKGPKRATNLLERGGFLREF